jgi:SPP1 family predicted phage head-tail adaptor
MEPGRLRHRVTIEELTVTLDSDGGQVEDWIAVTPLLSAEIAAMSGRELIAAQATQSKVATRIVLRHRPGIKASQRVRHRDTVYTIEAVIPDPKSHLRWVTLMCTSGVQFVNEAA